MTVEPAAWQTGRIPSSLRREAVGRLVSGSPLGRSQAVRRFLENAPLHGIDPDLIWGVSRERPPMVRQCCLAVIGSGRTANLFVAPPENLPQLGDGEQQHADRVASVESACAGLGELEGSEVVLAQALPEPGEGWAVRALLGAGFTDCGELAYLSRALGRQESAADLEGATVRAVSELEGTSWRSLVLEALEASYEGTLDCPELCGLRETSDILESHLAVGEHDPRLWWVVFEGERPRGCVLLNPCPEQDSVELVYIGLGRSLRGRGLGRRLLGHAIAQASRCGGQALTCAVDTRNGPALAMYAEAGFETLASRRALVRAVG